MSEVLEEVVDEVTSTKTLKFKKVHEDAQLPIYATDGSAGLDLTAVSFEIKESNVVAFDTGLQVQLPDGYFGAIYMRSGLGTKAQWRLANQVGILDCDYTGNLKIFLQYIGEKFSHKTPQKLVGTRIAQLVVQPYQKFSFIEEVDVLSETVRGDSGFGSTGV